VEPRWQALLRASEDLADAPRNPQRPLVDDLVFAPARQWARKPLSRETLAGLRDLRGKLRAGGYDAVLDLQGAMKSAVVSALAGTGRAIGPANPRETPARWFYDERIRTSGAHVIEQALELAGRVAGDDLRFQAPMLPLSPSAESWCGELLAGAEDAPLVLLNPGAGWGANCWPQERYAAVARALQADGCRVFISAGPGEEELARSIQKDAGGGARIILCTIEQLIAVSRKIDLLIAGDTGPLHLACALGRPVVGIYGPTEPGRNGPYGTRFKVLRSPLSRRDHSRHKTAEAGLLLIESGDVIRAARELMNESAGEGV
jgi:heptosyltransferase-1